MIFVFISLVLCNISDKAWARSVQVVPKTTTRPDYLISQRLELSYRKAYILYIGSWGSGRAFQVHPMLIYKSNQHCLAINEVQSGSYLLDKTT